MAATCPICSRAAKPRAENPDFPFCSARCKTIDLGKWVNEEYRVPVDDEPGEDMDEVLASLRAEHDGPGKLHS